MIKDMSQIVNYAKSYGFVYQGSEIYNGLQNTWDYGPLGVELKNTLKDLWYKEFVTKQLNVVGLDSSILLNSQVWEASGHLSNFSDPLIDCKECKSRYRVDTLIEQFDGTDADGWTFAQMTDYIKEKDITCNNCGGNNFTDIRNFQLMFKTNIGVTDEALSTVYLRPETAQGIFINYKNIMRTSRQKIPFGVGQIGKSFRNEITPGNFIFRTREFEQMELEFFCQPGSELQWFDFYLQKMEDFLKLIGLQASNYRLAEHAEDKLSHYSNRTIDIEYKYPFGYGELWGLASRTNYDLMVHEKSSGEDMKYLDPQTNEKYLPYVIEPAVGVDRLFLAVLCDAYDEEVLEDGTTREVLRISPLLAPVQVAVLPLVKKLSADSEKVIEQLIGDFRVDTDVSGKIGKRYRRQDVIGTPWCVTFDYDSLEDETVTVRERDSMEQTRVKISELNQYFKELL